MKNGIWKYSKILKTIDSKYWRSMGEGGTDTTNIAGIYMKREDLNPTGSYKDRGVAYRISKALENGEKQLVVTSTGNFAISMATYGDKFGIKIIVFVPVNISKEKANLLKNTNAVVYKVEKPILQAKQYCEENKIAYIRQSIDISVSEGFKTLMFEILESSVVFDSIIFPVSSGSLLLSTYQALLEQNINPKPKLIAVQTTYNTYIAREFVRGYQKSLIPSVASSLNVKLRPERLDMVVDAIKKTSGTALVVNEKDILNTKEYLWQNNVCVGYESSASFFVAQNMSLKGHILVISTGVLR